MTIRSYVKRHGRMSQAQKKAVETPNHPFLLNSDDSIRLDDCFETPAPTLLDIGFGMGESLIQLAQSHPDCHFIGVEVYPPGVGRALNQLVEHELTNARVIQEDVVTLLPKLPQKAFDRIHLFFPDPWPKSRHHKRRLVQVAWLEDLLKHLTPDGILHFATDDDHYAEQMAAVLDANQLIEPKTDQDTNNPLLCPNASFRPETKYARRALRLGHTCHDLLRRQSTR